MGDGKTCNQTLWALSTEDGKVLWNYNAMKVLENYYHKSLEYAYNAALPIAERNGTIYLVVSGEDNTTFYNAVVAVNRYGKTKWIFPISSYAGGLTIDKQGNIYALANKSLYSIAPNGTLRWKVKTNLDVCSVASIYKDRIYFVGTKTNSKQWKLFAYNTDGDFLWSYKTDDMHESFYATDWKYAPTIAPNGDIYLTNGKEIYSISPNGTLNWKLKISNAYFIVAGRDSYIYFSTGKDIYRVSPDGKARVLYELPDYKEGEKVLSLSIYIGPNQTIYALCGSDYGTYLYIFRNDPLAFLENPIFITAVVVIIAVPAIYFTVRKIRNKKVV